MTDIYAAVVDKLGTTPWCEFTEANILEIMGEGFVVNRESLNQLATLLVQKLNLYVGIETYLAIDDEQPDTRTVLRLLMVVAQSQSAYFQARDAITQRFSDDHDVRTMCEIVTLHDDTEMTRFLEASKAFLQAHEAGALSMRNNMTDAEVVQFGAFVSKHGISAAAFRLECMNVVRYSIAVARNSQILVNLLESLRQEVASAPAHLPTTMTILTN